MFMYIKQPKEKKTNFFQVRQFSQLFCNLEAIAIGESPSSTQNDINKMYLNGLVYSDFVFCFQKRIEMSPIKD